MLKILIIDDESHMCDSLIKLLAKHCPEVTVAGYAGSVSEAIKAIETNTPDLILLDIQLKDGTGFDVLEAFPERNFRVIFVTAFDEFALHAFRFSALDYLLKPVNPDLLKEAINKANATMKDAMNLQMNALRDNIKAIPLQQKKIIIKTTENIFLLELRDIIACESDNSYTTIFTKDGEKIMVAKTLKEYDDLLNGCGFFRLHKSYLINLSHIKRFERQDGGSIVLSNGIKVPVASRKRDEVLELLKQLSESGI